jgi:hypothetical protein
LVALVAAIAAAAACGGTTVTGGPIGSSGGADDGGAGTGADDGGAVCDPAPCAADGGTTPGFDTPSVCTSGTNWTRGDRGSVSMHPGVACIACHDLNNAPPFSIAGTVYPSAHEPDDCNGGGTAGAQIVITDANGKVTKIPVNSVGNFYSQGTIALPYRAKVVVGTTERAMVGSQKSGDCNSCHTETGASSAPGRIVLP